jgi:hypothetical protein
VNVAEEIKVASEDRLRADLYNFIGLMLSGPPDQLLINQCTGLSGDDGELGKAISSLSRVARVSKPRRLRASLMLCSWVWAEASCCPMRAITLQDF